MNFGIWFRFRSVILPHKAIWREAKIDNRVEIDVKHVSEWRMMLYER
jgi:hypothetical protein